jgi:hypothetical protein
MTIDDDKDPRDDDQEEEEEEEEDEKKKKKKKQTTLLKIPLPQRYLDDRYGGSDELMTTSSRAHDGD